MADPMVTIRDNGMVIETYGYAEPPPPEQKLDETGAPLPVERAPVDSLNRPWSRLEEADRRDF